MGVGEGRFWVWHFQLWDIFLGYENLAILFLGGLIYGGVCISWLQNTNI